MGDSSYKLPKVFLFTVFFQLRPAFLSDGNNLAFYIKSLLFGEGRKDHNEEAFICFPIMPCRSLPASSNLLRRFLLLDMAA